MSQEEMAEASSTEDSILLPGQSCELFQDDLSQTSSVSGLTPTLLGTRAQAGSRKRVLGVDAGGDMAVASPEAEPQAGLVLLELQTVGRSQDSAPSPKDHFQLPRKPAQRRASAFRRLQVVLHDILAEGWPRNRCGLPVSLRKRALRGREGPAKDRTVYCLRPKQARKAGRRPTLSKGKGSCRGQLPSSPSPAPLGAIKKNRKCEACAESAKGGGSLWWLGQSPDGDSPWPAGPPPGADLESMGSLCRPPSPKDSGLGPGDPSCEGCVSEAEKFECLLSAGDRAQPGSACEPESPLPEEGESLMPAAQGVPHSPALCLEVSGEASTERPEAGYSIWAGSGVGPIPSHNLEELEAQPVFSGSLGQGIPAPTDAPISSLEPPANKTPLALCQGRRKSQGIKKLRRGPVSHAQDQGTDRKSQDLPEEPSQEVCSILLSFGPKRRIYPWMAGSGALWSVPCRRCCGAASGSSRTALFDLTQATNCHYKTKYRSLLFNLRDPRSPELFLKVVHGAVTPHCLVRMTSIQLAPRSWPAGGTRRRKGAWR